MFRDKEELIVPGDIVRTTAAAATLNEVFFLTGSGYPVSFLEGELLLFLEKNSHFDSWYKFYCYKKQLVVYSSKCFNRPYKIITKVC